MNRGLIWLAGFVGTIFAANWAIETYGIVPIGFGLTAPAGVYFAGLAFTFRDGVHERLGWQGAVVAGQVDLTCHGDVLAELADSEVS